MNLNNANEEILHIKCARFLHLRRINVCLPAQRLPILIIYSTYTTAVYKLIISTVECMSTLYCIVHSYRRHRIYLIPTLRFCFPKLL